MYSAQSALRAPQSTESPASLDRPIGAIFECLIGSKRPVYTLQLQYSVKVATSSYTVQSKYMLVYPGSYMYIHRLTCSCKGVPPHSQAKEVYACLLESDTDGANGT